MLALRLKLSYVITLFSGLGGGTALWIYQYVATKNGLSLALFYVIVVINSIIAVVSVYKKKNYVNINEKGENRE